jgi:hypothetical protein
VKNELHADVKSLRSPSLQRHIDRQPLSNFAATALKADNDNLEFNSALEQFLYEMKEVRLAVLEAIPYILMALLLLFSVLITVKIISENFRMAMEAEFGQPYQDTELTSSP